MNWVLCDKCNRMELYENCGMEGEFDQKKVDALEFVCEMCKMNEWKTSMTEWKNGVDERLMIFDAKLNDVCERLDGLSRSVDVMNETSVKVVNDVKADDEERLSAIDVIASEVSAIGVIASVVAGEVHMLDAKVTLMQGNLGEVKARQVEFDELLESKDPQLLYSTVVSRKQVKENRRLGKDVQRTGDGRTGVAGSVAGRETTMQAGAPSLSAGPSEQPKRQSFAEKCAKYKQGTVLVIGSSMARGVGQHLKADNLMFDKLHFSGARIEDIKEKVAILGDKPDSHVVVMVGTNNLQRDGAVAMMRKYGELIQELKKFKYRGISICGLLNRGDRRKPAFSDSRILSLNCQLKALCDVQGVHFVDVAIDSYKMLQRDGLHLNWKGCDVVARSIFKHSCKCLNLL